MLNYAQTVSPYTGDPARGLTKGTPTMFKGRLIRSENNAKTVKGDGEYITAIMYLAPYRLSGFNVCAMAETAKCHEGCLFRAGRGRMSNVEKARLAKTQWYVRDRADFMAALVEDVAAFQRYCARKGVKPAIRLNGTSDIQWEVGHPVTVTHYRTGNTEGAHPVEYASIFEAFPDCRFYDYSKLVKRVYRTLPANYSLVLSYSEAAPEFASAVLQAHRDTGVNVAVVYRDKAARAAYMATGFKNIPVIDGDRDDLRFLDPQKVIVGLYAKGPAKADTSGFVIN